MLNYDRQITISAAGSRKATIWPSQKLWWSELVAKLQTPARGTETLKEYLAMPKSKQDDLKDVGGFVAGSLLHNRRKAANVIGRDVITLDMDNIPAGGTQGILRRVDGLGCSYCIYSTRKHEEARPRLRILLPTDRTVTADEYEPLARKLAELIGIEFCDPTTFEVHRLMFWPSCCSDSQYVYLYGDKPFLSADGVLAMYKDWHNVNEWPQVPGTQQTTKKLAAKQGDPTEKSGIVGAFCRTYDIHTAIATFIPDAYTPCSIPDRYTYTGGSTVAGAIVYDNGQFLYSHHATDPCSGKLVNSFDLVRIHKFGHLDDDAKPDTPTNRLPSFTAMCEFAVKDTHVAALLNQERYEKAMEEFQTSFQTSSDNTESDNLDWMKLLTYNTAGNPIKNIKNVRIVLENDPKLKGRIRLNRFANRIIGIGPLPWEPRDKNEEFEWSENDDAGLRGYLESILGFRSKDIVLDALVQTAAKQSFDPVVDYLTSLNWDGVPRLDTLFIDYLGVDDHPYTRAVTRKAFVAAVARAMTPGIKFDIMTVIHGPQGIGKSTLLRKMGKDWFSDSVNTVEGKEAAELLQGIWIVEIGELGAYSKSDVRMVKLFLSRQEDHYRAAYARVTERHPRRCVFFGTTNDLEYLRDPSGNRRFWPLTAAQQKPTKDVFNDLDGEIDQIWAEAYIRWQAGEPLYLSQELEEEADRRRVIHMEQDPLQGQIEEFLNQKIPEDWQNWNHDRRMMFWNGMLQKDGIKLVPRDRVCAIEIWRECIRDSRSTMSKQDAYRINAILEQIPGWERGGVMRFGSFYGRQKGFKRAILSVNHHYEKTENGRLSVNQVQKRIVNQVNHNLEKVDADG